MRGISLPTAFVSYVDLPLMRGYAAAAQMSASARFTSFTVEEVQADNDLIPTGSGVYAWFLRFDDVRVLSAEAMFEDIERFFEQPVSAYFSGEFGRFWHGNLRAKTSGLSPEKCSRLKVAMADAESRDVLLKALEAASLFQAPLYVGKADNLRSRILDHIRGTDMSERIKAAGWTLRNCEIRFIEVKATPEARDFNTLVEDLITRLCRPGFVLRPG